MLCKTLSRCSVTKCDGTGPRSTSRVYASTRRPGHQGVGKHSTNGRTCAYVTGPFFQHRVLPKHRGGEGQNMHGLRFSVGALVVCVTLALEAGGPQTPPGAAQADAQAAPR